MRKFETLLLLSPELAADAREALLGTFTGVIERAGGRFTADHWGMRDLAYPVRKQMRGYFVRLEYVAPGDTVAELERIIRISDGAFKFLTVKLADAAASAPTRICRWITSAPTFCATISRNAARSLPAVSLAPAPSTSACSPPRSSAPVRWLCCSTPPAIPLT